ncbi:MAG: universal stress protein, partial [Alicyclobacillus sp.]|nr:universal stress protein [Alicyclobacillus sp.]
YFASIQEDLAHVFQECAERVQYEHLYGRPAKSICDYAERHNVDCIVMGSHGRGIWDRLVMGSVSREVVQRAQTSVLVVKEPPARHHG